jgi:hypothetical protein
LIFRLVQYTADQGLLNGTFDDISEVAWDHSILVFPSPQEQTQVEHLQRLFALGVEWPWLEPAIRQLIKLPHNRFVDAIFWWFHKLHKGVAILTRVHPVRPAPKELWQLVKHFLNIKS